MPRNPPVQDRVVEAMRARRRELIAMPLDRIYRQLFEAGLAEHLKSSEKPEGATPMTARPDHKSIASEMRR